MNTKNSFFHVFISRSVLTISSVALSSIALGFTLYKSGPISRIFAATPADKCIVTILGVQYDLTTLGTMHSGPQGTTLTGPAGFFQCGTDMTVTYQSQHGTNVSRLAPYVYVAPTTTTTPTPTPLQPTPSPTITLSGTPTPTPLISPTPNVNQTHDDEENEQEDHEDDHNKNHEKRHSEKQEEEHAKRGEHKKTDD